MKLTESLLPSASAAFLLIGIHQGMKFGVQNSYFFFMISAGLFLWYTMRKKHSEPQAGPKKPSKTTPSAKSKRK